MNVYVWTNNLKNAYIGEYSEFREYDFRWKTKSQVTADWWNLQTEASIDSTYWLTSTTWGTNWYILPTAVSSSTNKITLVRGILSPGWIGLYITDNNRNYQSWNFIDASGNTVQIYCAWNRYDYTWTLSQDMVVTTVIDLDNKSITTQISWVSWTYTHTITDSEVSIIRSSSTRFRIALNSWCYVGYVKYKAE